jgi:hypothetical protein
MKTWPNQLALTARSRGLAPASTDLILGGVDSTTAGLMLASVALTRLVAILASLPKRVAQNGLRTYSQMAGFGRAETEVMLMMGKGPDAEAFARADAIRTSSGFKFVEVNVGTTASGTALFYGSMPAILGFNQPNNQLDPWARFLRSRVRQNSRGVVIDNSESDSIYRAYHALMVQQLRKRELMDVALIASEELQWDGRRLSLSGQPVDWAYPICFPKQLIAERERYESLTEAAQCGAVAFPVDFCTRLMGSKLAFAMLYELRDEGRLSEEEGRIVDEFVPRTFSLDEGKFGDALRGQALYSLKPATGSGGAGVVVGADVGTARWRAALNAALNSVNRFVLQETCEALAEPALVATCDRGLLEYEARYVWGFFVAGGRPCGEPMLRCKPLSSDRIINHATGAAIGPLPPA